MLVMTYSVDGSGTTNAGLSTHRHTALNIRVVREEDAAEYKLIVMSSRFYDENGTAFALAGSTAGSPTNTAGLLDATQSVSFWLPYEDNSAVLRPGGTFRSKGPVTVQASDGSWSAAVSVNVKVRTAVTLTVPRDTVSPPWTSASFTAPGSSAYFVTTDSAIGPTDRVWWGGASTTLNVPLHSSCDPQGAPIIATFVAQQEGCTDTWQMNAGRGASECAHELVLTLDSTANTWRSDSTLDGCELRTHPVSPVIIEARRWHAPEANKLLGEVTIEVISAALFSEIPLNAGWNWISINRISTDMTIAAAFPGFRADDMIKSQTGFTQYYDGTGWFGGLTALEVDIMYAVRCSVAKTLQIRGEPIIATSVLPSSVPVQVGWNWLPMHNSGSGDVASTFEVVGVKAGDVLKSQTSFTQYYVTNGFVGWFGDLTTLEPSKGYKLKVSNATAVKFKGS